MTGPMREHDSDSLNVDQPIPPCLSLTCHQMRQASAPGPKPDKTN
ncbi:unnamed protein product [Protopolystoma xenopodis]|uniref:Uncharacterized protein n=1 Tax=Protopolystoma xenopodis TaxID=117903 RepID=A0A3S5AV29_9PLAT|nr:unnamed protein product [Protopolystoma xenopodis]